MVVVKTVISAGPIGYSYNGIFQMVNVLFSLCVNSGHGGALWIDNVNSKCLLVLCTFSKCQSGDHGGAVYILRASLFQAKSICFSNNYAYRCGSILTQPSVKALDMSYIDEIYDKNNEAASYLHAYENLSVSYANLTNVITSVYSSGIGLGTCKYGELIKYSQMANCYGPTLFAYYGASTVSAISVFKLNFINATSTIAMFEYRNGYIDSSIRNCVFKQVNSMPILRCFESGSGIASFTNCIFPFPFNPSHFSSQQQSQNTFNRPNPETNLLNLFETKECWNDPITPMTHHIPAIYYSPMFIRIAVFSNLVVNYN